MPIGGGGRSSTTGRMAASDHVHDRLGVALLADTATLGSFRPVHAMLAALAFRVQCGMFLGVQAQRFLADRRALDRAAVLVALEQMVGAGLLDVCWRCSLWGWANYASGWLAGSA